MSASRARLFTHFLYEAQMIASMLVIARLYRKTVEGFGSEVFLK